MMVCPTWKLISRASLILKKFRLLLAHPRYRRVVGQLKPSGLLSGHVVRRDSLSGPGWVFRHSSAVTYQFTPTQFDYSAQWVGWLGGWLAGCRSAWCFWKKVPWLLLFKAVRVGTQSVGSYKDSKIESSFITDARQRSEPPSSA